MKLNLNIILALSFGALTTAHAGFINAHPRGKPLITSSSIVSPPLSIVTIPCNTTTSAGTSAPPFSIPQNTSSPSLPSVTAVGTITVPCIQCPESIGPPVISPPTITTITTITTTTFVTVPCSSEVESVPVPSQPVSPVIAPPLNTAPTNVVPPQNTGPAVPAFPSGSLIPSKVLPTPGGEVPGASNTEIPSPPSSSVPIAPAPPAASSQPAGPASPQSPAPSPTGPPRPPAFTGDASALAMNPRGTVMALVVAALAIF